MSSKKFGTRRRLPEKIERRHDGDKHAAHGRQPAEETGREAVFKRGDVGAYVGSQAGKAGARSARKAAWSARRAAMSAFVASAPRSASTARRMTPTAASA